MRKDYNDIKIDDKTSDALECGELDWGDLECEGLKWAVDTPFGEVFSGQKVDAFEKAQEWMSVHEDVTDREIVREYIKQIVGIHGRSLSVRGLEASIEHILDRYYRKITCDELQEILGELSEKNDDDGLLNLLTVLTSKKEAFEDYRMGKVDDRIRKEANRRRIEEFGKEIDKAELVSNEDLEGKTIMIESNSRGMVLCRVRGKEDRLVGFKPTHYQSNALVSWFFNPDEWPLVVRVARSPKRRHFIFIKPIVVKSFHFNGKYLIPEFSYAHGKNVGTFASARELLHKRFAGYYNQDKKRYEIETKEGRDDFQRIVGESNVYEIEFVDDNDPYIVVAPIGKECLHTYEVLGGETRKRNLRDICLAYKIENGIQRFLMRSMASVNYALAEFGAKPL